MRVIMLLAVIAALLSFGCICGLFEFCPTDYAPVCGEDGESYYNDCYARQAGVEVAYNGTCMGCNDSESTGDILVYGEVVYNGITYADQCYDSSSVTEYYCSDGELVEEVKPCPEGYSCSGGVCAVSGCVDSDGDDIYTKGTVTKGEETYTDLCSDGNVVEYLCTDGQVTSSTASCPEGYSCYDGACIVSGCEDTEEGTGLDVAGTVTKDGTEYTDSCYDDDTVMEYYCIDDEVGSEYYDCAGGYYCSEGICKESVDCEDSDSGKNMYTKGTITKDDSTYSDYCVDSDTVHEYFCNFNFIASDWLNCPTGYRCEDGECVEKCSETDFGRNEYEQGTTYVGISDYEDFCASSNVVGEYYCSGTGYAYSTITCPSGFECDDGECVYAGTDCTDSDGGVDRFDEGTVVSDGDSDTDYCIDSDTVREYYCGTGGDSFSFELDCPEDYSCEDGECVYSPTDDCSDTDDGQDIYERGTVTEDSIPYTDYCYDTDTVWEYYCLEGSAHVTQKDCPIGYSCFSGECIYSTPETCSDTDGGYYPYDKGTVTKEGTAYTDYCNTGSSVREYYCSGTDVYSSVFSCPSGYGCSDGECVEVVHNCTDNDGTDIYTYGSVTYDSVNYYDYCKNSTHVYEYYCSDPPHKVAQYCGWGYGCSGGACVPQCSDTDGGIDLMVSGTARYGTDSQTDYCSSSSSVVEYYCGVTGILSTPGVCSSGYKCSGGKCVVGCTDTDGGNEPGTYGTVRVGTSTYNDACYSRLQVKEYYCVGDSYASATVGCGAGEICSSGVCAPECSDDDADDAYNAGTVTYGLVTYDDYCIGGNTVREYICTSETTMSYHDIECTVGDYHYCSGGRCFGFS